jgi:hypothetical protein
MAYIFPAPGVAGVQATLTLSVSAVSLDPTMSVPAMQDITVNNSNDVFTWTQLDQASKLQVATTATNSLDLNCVLDQDAFFGTFITVANEAALPTSGMTIGTIYFATSEASWHKATSATVTVELSGKPATAKGIFGLSKDKDLVAFSLYLGDTSTGTTGKTITGVAYVTGLAPTVSADSPVWVSPVTLTVTGDYTVA